MDEHAIRRILEGNGGPAGNLLRALLYIPGKAYGIAMQTRRQAYLRNLFKSHKSTVPVIAIGNLTAGGSGKTPMTLLIARELKRMGKTPAILLRGYRQTEASGSDEANLYQTLAPEILVKVNADRRQGARQAVASGADVLLMDDGFQHLKLRRDLDIVLIDATCPWGGGNTLPGGLLREPKSTLRHAGLVIITRSNQIPHDDLHRLLREIRPIAHPVTPVLTATHQPTRLYSLENTDIALGELKDRKVVLLCGIARPEAFEATVRELGAVIVALRAGGDHHNFDRQFVLAAIDEAESRDAVLVTTEKDRAKGIFKDLAEESADNINGGMSKVKERVWVLGVEQRVDGETVLFDRIRAVFS